MFTGKIPRHFGDYDPLGQVGSESSEEGVQEEEDEDNWRLAREADGTVGIRASSAWGNSFSRYPVTPSGTADCSIDLSADMDVGDNKVELLTLQKHHMSPELTDGTARLQAPDSDTELQTPLRVQPIVAKPLETWRMVAFVLSLILCILCTMSFAFLIPCPGHQSRRAHWNISFPDASSTIALVSVRLQKDSTPGIVVLYRASNNSSGNDSCAFSGVPAPCSVLVALSLADGLVLWKHREPGIAHALVCSGGVQTSQNSSTICVMTKGDGTLIAFDPIDGHMIWVIRSTPDDHLIDLVWPLLFLPDLNSDGIVEVLLACAQASPRKNTSLFYVISGSTGKPIGQPVPYDLPIGKEEPTPVIHLHDGKDADVIYSTGPELLALSVSEMYKLALIQSEILSAIRTSIVSKKQHKPLGLSPHTLFRSRHGPFIQLTLIPGNGGDENSSLLLMTSWQMTLLIGPALNHSLWSISLGPVYSCPAFGRFSNDSFSDIMVQTLNGSGFSKVSLLDGENGQEVWTARTCGGEVPPPSVLPFGNDLFAFVFWSLGNPLESQSTNCSKTGSPYSLWMLRADLPHTLFALANSSSRPIISNVLSEWGNEPTLVSISRAGRHLSSGLLLQAWLLQFDLPKKVALTVPSDLQSLD